MKQILLAVVAGTAAFSASAADGTFSASNIIGGVRQYIYDLDGAKLAVDKGAVQFVYNGAVVGAGVYGFRQPGTFSAGVISIPGQAGNTVSITIEVWDKAMAATYDQSLAGAYYWPRQTVTITLGGAGNPPATAAALTGYLGGGPTTPEPSSVALAALGLGGLLLISRRK